MTSENEQARGQLSDHDGQTSLKHHHGDEQITHGSAKREKWQSESNPVLDSQDQAQQQLGVETDCPVIFEEEHDAQHKLEGEKDCSLNMEDEYDAREQLEGKKKDCKARPPWRMRYYKMIDQQTLREMVLKAYKTHSLCDLHPAAHSVRKDYLVLPDVPVAFHRRLSDLVESLDAFRLIKLDFTQRISQAAGRASTHGRLIITMPGVTMPEGLHERFKSFAGDTIRDQVRQKGFLPSRFYIHSTGSPDMQLNYGDKTRLVAPGDSIAIDNAEPFLVVECAHTELEKYVMRKARDFMFGAKPRMNFVVVLIIDTHGRPESDAVSGAAPQTTATAGPQIQLPPLLTEHDKVTVSVYSPVISPNPQTGRNMLSIDTNIDHLEVFPNPATDQDYFTIRWRDVNCGPWDSFKASHGMPDDLPEPTCDISMSALSERVAERLAQPRQIYARKAVDDVNLEINPNLPAKFNSSSPETMSSPSESGDEDEDRRRRDTTYDPTQAE